MFLATIRNITLYNNVVIEDKNNHTQCKHNLIIITDFNHNKIILDLNTMEDITRNKDLQCYIDDNDIKILWFNKHIDLRATTQVMQTIKSLFYIPEVVYKDDKTGKRYLNEKGVIILQDIVNECKVLDVLNGIDIGDLKKVQFSFNDNAKENTKVYFYNKNY